MRSYKTFIQRHNSFLRSIGKIPFYYPKHPISFFHCLTTLLENKKNKQSPAQRAMHFAVCFLRALISPDIARLPNLPTIFYRTKEQKRKFQNHRVDRLI